MTTHLRDAYQCENCESILYDLLSERIPSQSISHTRMPSMGAHKAFVRSRPYRAWYLVFDDDTCVGSVYLSKDREIGVFIFNAHQRKGHGKRALELLMEQWPGRFLANINPLNTGSIRLFQSLGFKHLQNTYELKDVNGNSR